MDIKKNILKAVKTAVSEWLKKKSISLPEFSIEPVLEQTKTKGRGDLTTNIAFQLSPVTGINPREIAEEIAEIIKVPSSVCERIKPAGSGFINFYLAPSVIHNILRNILANKFTYGRSDLGRGRAALLEFVSANPTGPLTIAHARQAAVGDVLANIFDSVGYKTEREYYLNDRGKQMNILAISTRARYMELLGRPSDFPENGYKGEYIKDIANSIIKDIGDKYLDIPENDSISFFLKYAKMQILKMIKDDLRNFGVVFTNWVSEKEIVSANAVDEVLHKLEEKGYIYNSEGAQWFKSTAFGDDKDRVLIKSSGDMTYLTPDIAYHNNKYSRGFNILINIWGPDHHGYVSRIKAAVEALGHPKESLKILLVQLATLYRNGEPISMSTRAGEFVSLKELIQEVGTDAARYYLIMRHPEAHLDFDLETAKKETMDNPVYYIQYAYARISSIIKKYEESCGNSTVDMNWDEVDFSYLKETEAAAIINYLSQYSEVLKDCSMILSPHLVAKYLEGLVSKFHKYYEKYRVINPDAKLTAARIGLISGVRTVLKNGLGILGVSARERM